MSREMDANEAEPRYVISIAARMLNVQTYTLRYYMALFTNPSQSFFYVSPAEAIRNSLLVFRKNRNNIKITSSFFLSSIT